MSTTGKYNHVQLGSLHFTTDGTSSGFPCKSSVKGLENIIPSYTWQTIIAIDGEPYLQGPYPVKGVPVSTTFEVMHQDVLFSVIAAVNTAVGGSTTQTLKITEGAYGDFNLTVYPASPFMDPLGEFYLTNTKQVTFNWTVKSVGRLLTVSPGTLTLTGQSVTLTQG
jgi:hypothetical protein